MLPAPIIPMTISFTDLTSKKHNALPPQGRKGFRGTTSVPAQRTLER